jgi:asparagine synthase (glutamine-hydrolysing)
MCGITGIWLPRAAEPTWLKSAVQLMANAVHHRGPDATGVWLDQNSGLAFGHKRLAIVDITSAGAQPMVSHSGRYVLNFNGEIYNHLDLRLKLAAQGKAPEWRGHSDTETLITAIDAWGLEVALEASIGMFAFAVWDRSEKRLWLARDRVGEKPLYYGNIAGAFVFGSEIGALKAYPKFSAEIDHASVAALLGYLYIPEPFSIYKGIYKLLPGHLLEVRDGVAQTPKPWWSLEQSFSGGRKNFASAPEAAEIDALEKVLSQAVQSQMLGDVPIGCLLSGGIDSSLIASLMQANSARPIKTYSIGFENDAFNEAPYAKKVAQHLGTDHSEFIVTAADALKVVPELSAVYGEPFADSSQIPSLMLARLARRDITVALSGEGGDEVFGGYSRYIQLPKAWALAAPLPQALRALISIVARNLRAGLATDASAIYRLTSSVGFKEADLIRPARLLGLLGTVKDPQTFYAALVSVENTPLALLSKELDQKTNAHPLRAADITHLETLGAPRWMMANDTLGYLPGDILVKMDRAAMAASLETRAPFLDERVLRWAWAAPTKSLVADGLGKRCLRELLSRYIPTSLVNRPKQGFSIPMDSWLRGSLRAWASDLLSTQSIRKVGFLDEAAIQKIWTQHQAGVADHGHRLWGVLMLQEWALSNKAR